MGVSKKNCECKGLHSIGNFPILLIKAPIIENPTAYNTSNIMLFLKVEKSNFWLHCSI